MMPPPIMTPMSVPTVPITATPNRILIILNKGADCPVADLAMLTTFHYSSRMLRKSASFLRLKG
jgi:hypothetical protein